MMNDVGFHSAAGYVRLGVCVCVCLVDKLRRKSTLEKAI